MIPKQTNWDAITTLAHHFENSRWPYVGAGILDLVPHLKSEKSFEEAWIFTSHGTVVILFPSGPIRRFHIIANESANYDVYWYDPDQKNEIRYTVPLTEVVLTIRSNIAG